jgi:cation transport protein ChaC
MANETDPFAHHPGLRDKITDPLKSFFRDFKPSDMDPIVKEHGFPDNWRRTDGEIERTRKNALAGRLDGDLWVFGYGSLMWDPAFIFSEVRRGRIVGYHRNFCLKDTMGGRGTRELPGLMAALDEGGGCNGLAFRIEAERVDEETAVLWRREMIAPAYKPIFAEVTTQFGTIEALSFAADHNAAMIDAEITRSQQVRYIATGTGILGSSLEYLENMRSHFDALGIVDKEILELVDEVSAYRNAARQE